MMNLSRTRLRPILFFLVFAAAAALRAQSFHRNYDPASSHAHDVVETADGGFVLVGGVGADSFLFLQRTDAFGSVLWAAHQYVNGARGIAVCRANDGGFAVLCENYADTTALLRSVVLKIDSLGTVQWQRVLAYPGMSNGFVDIAATPGGGFAVLGSARTLGQAPDIHLRVLQLDAAGNDVWSQILGDPNDGKEIPRTLVVLPGGDLVVAAERREAADVLDGSDILLARLDATGNVLWQTEYHKPGYQVVYDLQADHNGHLVVLGETKQTDPITMTILKTDGTGNEIWYKHPFDLFATSEPSDPFRTISCLVLDAGGNMYIPYRTQDFLDPNPTASVLRLNAIGEPVWIRQQGVSTDVIAKGVFTTDQHFAFVGGGDASGNTGKAFLWKTDWTGGTFLSALQGSLFWDKNANCSLDTADSAPPTFVVEARHSTGNSYYRQTNAAGQYTFFVPILGMYTIFARPNLGLDVLWQACDTLDVQVMSPDSGMYVPPIGLQSTVDCPYLDIDLSAGPLRRCTTSVYYAQYCNRGTAIAEVATASVVLDAHTTYEASSVPLAGQNGDTLFFDLGDVLPGDCRTFSVAVFVSCAVDVGQTLCASVRIFPDTSCLPPDPQWDGSNVTVSATCNGSAEFVIRNTGAGDMLGPVDYVIIEDQIMFQGGSIQLGAGADTTIVLADPAGYSYFVQTGQRPGHPFPGLPAAAADGCNGAGTGESLALQLPVYSGDPHADVYCAEIVASFDPNDKRGFPLGWRDEHYLEIGQDLEYMIRFQNTGNDTAFLVVIRDTLPPALDAASVRPGAASHPYTFQWAGANNTLVFTFANILLPDSTTNEPASNGFVTFRVAQQPDLGIGTIVENRAAIYFDFNEPIVTDPYFHTIGRPLLTIIPAPPTLHALDLLVFPNPTSDYADFRISHRNSHEHDRYRFRLFGPAGQTLREVFFSGETFRFYRNSLAPGVYFFRLENTAGSVATGKIVIWN